MQKILISNEGVMAMRRIGIALAVASFGVIAAAAATQSAGKVYLGMCDASAGVAFSKDPSIFFVGNDEDQDEVVLRTYSLNAPPGSLGPIHESHITAEFLKLEADHQEVDVEGATRIGEMIYWIGVA